MHGAKNQQAIEQRPSPVHIVTSESAAGSLRFSMTGPKTVIGFPDALSIGPLGKLDEEMGQALRTEWLSTNINTGERAEDYANKFRNALQQIQEIPQHVPIYLWFGDNALEQIGLRFYQYLLRDKPNDIYGMNTTQLYQKHIAAEDGSAFFHTGLLDSTILKLFLERERDTEAWSAETRTHFLQQWQALAETAGVLRVWKDGEIRNVPEDHYDSLILETVEKLQNEQGGDGFVLAARVVGDIVAEMDEFIDYFFLEYRMRQLVDMGALEITGVATSMRDYGVKIRSTKLES